MTTDAQPLRLPPFRTDKNRRPSHIRLREILAHPLVLLIVGAWLSGLLIPRLTQGWQDREKALEIRTQLVSAMSEDATHMMTSIQEVRRHPRATIDRDAFSRGFTQWSADSAVIGAKIQAYFPRTTLPADWGNLSGAIGEFYAIQMGQIDGARQSERRDHERKIARRLSAVLGPAAAAEWKKADPGRWWSIRDTILVARAELVRRVLANESVALR